MKAGERGFLLLSSHLGDPERRPLTTAQLRTLASRMQASQRPDADRDLAPEDVIALGYSRAEAMSALAGIPEKDLTTEEYIKKALKNLF